MEVSSSAEGKGERGVGENLGERFETPHGEQEWTYKWGEISAEGRRVARWSDGLGLSCQGRWENGFKQVCGFSRHN